MTPKELVDRDSELQLCIINAQLLTVSVRIKIYRGSKFNSFQILQLLTLYYCALALVDNNCAGQETFHTQERY